MSRGEQTPPAIVLHQPSLDKEEEKSTLLSNKSNIGRSNSAPQAQNQFTESRLGTTRTAKGNPPSCSGNSPKQQTSSKHAQVLEAIPTLSDGLIRVNEQDAAQAVASIMSSQQESSSSVSALHSSASNSPMSPTPLCDSNHSPSSIKRYYQQVSPLFNKDPTPEDVWQKREHFIASKQDIPVDQSEGISSSSSVPLPRRLKSKSECHPSGDLGLGTVVAVDSPDAMSCNGAASDSPQVKAQRSTQGEAVLSSSAGLDKDRPSRVETGADMLNGHRFKSESLDSGVEMRSSPIRHPFRQAHSEVLADVGRRMSIADVKEKGYAKLEEELAKAQMALALKDEEVDELRGIRERLMKEVSDFTASLFEEVNSQLNEAALSEQSARRQLQEANAKIEVLTAELAALKNLVLTSTPSSPNKHLHPQIDQQAAKKEKNGKPFWKTHRRSTSHHQFTKEARERAEASQNHAQLKEMDTVVFDEFSRWCLQPTMDLNGQFFTRVLQEDIGPCLNFKNTRLSNQVQESVKQNSLTIEPIPGDSSFPRKCCLSETHKLCNYKIKFEGDGEWYSISQMSRNRIAAVCDFFAYVRYIVQGLVKSSEKDMFVQMVKLRHQMTEARLGLI